MTAEGDARPPADGGGCVYDAAAAGLLARCAGCSRAQKLNIAEREAIACRSPAGHTRCTELFGLLHHNALFALKLTHLDGPLPHGKEMKVQCGGLLGLRAVQEPAAEGPVTDVYGLLEAARIDFGGLERLPFGEIVKRVVAYEPRKRAD